MEWWKMLSRLREGKLETQSPEWAVNELRLRMEVEMWIREAMRRQRPVPFRGGHDEGTFASSWVAYYLLTGNRECLQFLYWMRDTFLEWSRGNQYHGYYRVGEIHHQTETYNNFVGHLWRLEKTDVNVAVLEDAAHHVGNWVRDIPEWYDWEKHRFRSWWLGTCEVRDHPPYDFETCDHFRLMKMVLNAYLATGNEQYLQLARDYSDRWCKLILEGKEMPTILYPIDDPDEITKLYGAARSAGSTAHDTVTFKENIGRYLGGGVLDALLDLYALTGEKRYIEASAKALDQLCTMFEHPPAISGKYRDLTGDTRYDERVLNLIEKLGEFSLPTILMFEGFERSRARKEGYRAEDGTVRERLGPSSSYLLLGYQISGDEKLLDKAMMLAQRRLTLARPFIRDGREHGCDSRYLHGVGSEAVHVLCSATLGLYTLCGSYFARIQYFRGRRTLGLPYGVAALLEPTSKNEKNILLYNILEEDEPVGIKVTEKGARIKSLTVDGAPSKNFAGNRATVGARNKKVTKVKIMLK